MASLRRLLDASCGGPSWRFVAPLSALYVLAYLVADVLPSYRVPLVQGGLVAAAGAVLLWPRVRRTAWVWWAMAGLMLCAFVESWMLFDNHVFLASYWLLAIGCARAAPPESRAPALALAASTLIGLTMLFATVHKLRTPEYVSGDFFHMTFLTDARFAPLGWVVGEDLTAIVATNSERLRALESDPSSGPIVLATGGAAIGDLARRASWVVLVFEIALALLWLVRAESTAGRQARHAALLGFAVCTYVVAPVPGFGALLLILGVADTRPNDSVLRASYLAVLVHVLVSAALVRALLLE